MIFLDTPILSIAYRRKYKDNEEKPIEAIMLQQMVAEHKPIIVPGIVLQEFLSGLRFDAQFNKLKKLVEGFPIILATQHHHIETGKIANACRSQGVTTSATDCLIAAMAIEQKAQFCSQLIKILYIWHVIVQCACYQSHQLKTSQKQNNNLSGAKINN